MKDIFSFIYEIFRSLYGGDLADHLYGVDPKAVSLYVLIGTSMFILSFILSLLYYKVLDSPKPKKSLRWFTFLVINAAINGFLGWYLPYRDYQAGNIRVDIKNNIDNANIMGFGFVNAIVAVLFFALISIFMRRFSNNNRLTPFGTKIL